VPRDHRYWLFLFRIWLAKTWFFKSSLFELCQVKNFGINFFLKIKYFLKIFLQEFFLNKKKRVNLIFLSRCENLTDDALKNLKESFQTSPSLQSLSLKLSW